MPSSDDYGERFVKAWKEQGAGHSELGAWDLENLERADQGATLALLRKLPGIGESSALDDAEEREPEELAEALAEERRAAQEAAVPLAEQSWGARFLHAYLQAGGTFSEFSYAEAQTLKTGNPGQVEVCLRDKFGVTLDPNRIEPEQAVASIRAT